MNSADKNRRIELNKKFRKIPGVKAVYFQPPADVKIQYPCIIYNRDAGYTRYADDKLYYHKRRYTVTVIDPDPDTDIPDTLLKTFSLCSPDRDFISGNLNHYVFTLYY